jgi:hypothetical protein
LKEALLAEIQKTKKFFYGTVIAQAQRIDVDGDRVTMAFAPNHATLKVQFDQNRPWLEELASRIAGRKIAVVAADGATVAGTARPGEAGRGAASAAGTDADKQTALKEKAMADSGVQALLDVFRTDIKEVEEM